jgi:hypothetical protein
MERKPSFPTPNAPWYNYQASTSAAAAVDMMDGHPLPAPAPPPARRVFADPSFHGVRSQWDNVTAVAAASQMSDSLAGVYLANKKEPFMPLGAALVGVFFEVAQGGTHFRCVEWQPILGTNAIDGFAAANCLTNLCAPYWGDMPFLPGEGHGGGDIVGWASLQHWAVWQDHLIGLGALLCNTSGGAAGDMARIRCRLAPAARPLKIEEQSDVLWRFNYGGLSVRLARLEAKGEFSFRALDKEQPPLAEWTPGLAYNGPWLAGDFLHAGVVAAPASAEGSVVLKALPHGAAALLMEASQRKAFLWVANLDRHWQQYLLPVPAGASVKLFRKSVEMPPVPAGAVASAGLQGAENGVWVIESPTPLNSQAILAGLRAGKGR